MRYCKDCHRRLAVTNISGYCTPCGKRHRCWKCCVVHPAGKETCNIDKAKRATRRREERRSTAKYCNYVSMPPEVLADPVRLERIERYKERAKEGRPLFTKDIAPTTERAT